MTRQPHCRRLSALALLGVLCLLASCGGGGAAKPLADPSPVTAVAFSPDGTFVAGSDKSGEIRLWEVASRNQARMMRVQERDDILKVGLNVLLFTPDGKTLISGGDDGKVRTWDAATGQEGHTLLRADSAIKAIAISRDGRMLAVGNTNLGSTDTRRVRLLDPASGAEIKALPIPVVAALAFSPDGKTLAVGNAGDVALWDVATGASVRSLAEGKNSLGLHGTGYTVAFSPDGTLLASGGLAKTVSVWDPRGNDTTARSLEGYATGYSGPIQAVAFSPDGKTLASGNGERAIKLWDPAAGTERRTLDGHKDGTLSVAFSPDGKTLASGGNDMTVRLWDVASGKAK